MRIRRHPLTRRDVRDILRHVADSSGDVNAAVRRRNEIATLTASIAANPHSGTRLGGRLRGWLVRHGGTRQMVTVVFRPDDEARAVLIALIAFGAQDWLGAMDGRRDFAG